MKQRKKISLKEWDRRLSCKGYESKLQDCRMSKPITLFKHRAGCPNNSYAYVSCQKRCLTTGTLVINERF